VLVGAPLRDGAAADLGGAYLFDGRVGPAPVAAPVPLANPFTDVNAEFGVSLD
jgi:hypothetical protein